jgi:hypothetical protein
MRQSNLGLAPACYGVWLLRMKFIMLDDLADIKHETHFSASRSSVVVTPGMYDADRRRLQQPVTSIFHAISISAMYEVWEQICQHAMTTLMCPCYLQVHLHPLAHAALPAAGKQHTPAHTLPPSSTSGGGSRRRGTYKAKAPSANEPAAAAHQVGGVSCLQLPTSIVHNCSCVLAARSGQQVWRDKQPLCRALLGRRCRCSCLLVLLLLLLWQPCYGQRLRRLQVRLPLQSESNGSYLGQSAKWAHLLAAGARQQ